jgi:hypothetical protein
MHPRISSFLFILVYFIIVIVPLAAAMAVVTGVVTFFLFANRTLKNLLENREGLLLMHSISKTVKETIKKNTIDV